jgi:hypothetical protein
VEFALFPYGEVYAGRFVWPYERHLEVVEGWHAWTRTAGEDITTSFRILHFPPQPELPPFLSGRSVVMIDGAFAGDAEAGRASLIGLRTLAPEVDEWSMMSPVALSRLHLDPEPPIPVLSTSALLDDLEPSCYEALAAAAQEPLTVGEIRHIGGALARVPAGAGSLGSFPGQYLALGGGIVTDQNRHDLLAGLDRFGAALAPYANGSQYYNFSESPTDATRFYREDAYARLRRLRAEVDPDGIVVANHPIPAASGAR